MFNFGPQPSIGEWVVEVEVYFQVCGSEPVQCTGSF